MRLKRLHAPALSVSIYLIFAVSLFRLVPLKVALRESDPGHGEAESKKRLCDQGLFFLPFCGFACASAYRGCKLARDISLACRARHAGGLENLGGWGAGRTVFAQGILLPTFRFLYFSPVSPQNNRPSPV
jgi:hypothetical protein